RQARRHLKLTGVSLRAAAGLSGRRDDIHLERVNLSLTEDVPAAWPDTDRDVFGLPWREGILLTGHIEAHHLFTVFGLDGVFGGRVAGVSDNQFAAAAPLDALRLQVDGVAVIGRDIERDLLAGRFQALCTRRHTNFHSVATCTAGRIHRWVEGD